MTADAGFLTFDDIEIIDIYIISVVAGSLNLKLNICTPLLNLAVRFNR